ncbi:MAG: biotin carboxylase N-terminal domain-containing protein [Candidatus Babeliales bacterium]|jgi:acetyl-CoA carboxylase biotin carboxylase subunit
MRKLRQKLAPRKVLIAHRSEIALRIQAACHARGIATVAVYCPDDRNAAFVAGADEAYALSKQGYEAYTDVDALIAIAHKAGADALHPGYGFLSENAQAAQKITDDGLIWIGPRPEVIALMADKVAARKRMKAAGVPVVPGWVVTDFSPAGKEAAWREAQKVGFPLIIKDPYGGGGKAMQCVRRAEDFPSVLVAVHAQAQRLTGSTCLLIEKFIEQSRHVEVQIAGDGQNFIHLFERECSVQRRHQKIIEETPCISVPGNVLECMYDVALRAAQGVAYDSIGTVEFIVTPDNNFYFLEMNTRLQVEHAITEMVTGIDLVTLQLDVATHQVLPFVQGDVVRRGHAVECRLYAEDPATNFTPSTGTITYLHMPSQPFTRCEHDLYQGVEVTPFFDPMLAKCITWGITRQEAINRMTAMLRSLAICGVTTNQNFLRAIMMSDEFARGDIDTQRATEPEFMQRMLRAHDGMHDDGLAAGLAVAIAAYAREKSGRDVAETTVSVRGWRELQWR